MTILAFAEHISKCLSERADDVQMDRRDNKVSYTAKVGKHTFVVTIEDLAKDDQEPSIT